MILTATTGEKTTEEKKKNSRGTRRQQRYRAKQKLWQLCEVASARQVSVADVNIDIHIVDEMGNTVEASVVKVCFEMLSALLIYIYFVHLLTLRLGR